MTFSRVLFCRTLAGVTVLSAIWWLHLKGPLNASFVATSRQPRVAVVTVDNRELPSELDLRTAGYWTIGAINNADYARSMGYDFLYLQLARLTDIAIEQALNDGETICSFPAPLLMGAPPLGPRPKEEEDALRKSGNGHKDVVQMVHIGRKAYRAASWGKLLALWTIADEYDLVLFVDSDALIIRDVSFLQALSDAEVVYGHGVPSASLVMLGNRPFWREEMPCAGVFMVRTAPHGRDLLRRWWDGSGNERNHAYEQDTLWDILDGAGHRMEPLRDRICAPPRLNKTTVTVVGTRQFLKQPDEPFEEFASNGSWVLHIGHGSTEGRRVPEALANLRRRGVDTVGAAALLADIRARSLRIVDPLAAALALHAASCDEARRCQCCRAGNWWD